MTTRDAELVKQYPYLFFVSYEGKGKETVAGLKDKSHMEKFILECKITELVRDVLLPLAGDEPTSTNKALTDFLKGLFQEFHRNNPNFNHDVLIDILKQEEEG